MAYGGIRIQVLYRYEVHKIYLSAILDLYNQRIVVFKIRRHRDNALVRNTFYESLKGEPFFTVTEAFSIQAKSSVQS